MGDFQKGLIALLALTIVAVLVGSGQTSGFIQSLTTFLANMVKKVESA